MKTILYVGSLEKESNSRKRFLTLQKMGYHVEGIDVDPYIFVPFWLRLHYHLYVGPGIVRLNADVLDAIERLRPDLLWVDNKPYLKRKTLRRIRKRYPSMKLANIITDDPFGSFSYCWRRIYNTFSQYDIQFVQRGINIDELTRQGARRVELCYRSYDPDFHRPMTEVQALRDPAAPVVGFIGSYEEEREEYIAFLVQHGIPVQITGNGWPNGRYWNILKSYYKGPSVFGQAYVEAINRMDIALHFLRKINRDQQDSRTFEIPACGTFMLAERSHVHLEHFREGEEVAYFTSREEMLMKVRYYLDHPEERLRLANAALRRSQTDGYDHQSRLRYVLDRIYAPSLPPKPFERMVAAIYIDPDFYPPTINAMLNLSELCRRLVVVTRNQAVLDFPFPSHVELVKLGCYRTVLETEAQPLIWKIASFLSFTFAFARRAWSPHVGVVVSYDSIPLWSHFLIRPWLRGPKVHWYHNHDMPVASQLRRFSVGWWAARYEHAALRKMDLFTLPSSDRLAFYPPGTGGAEYHTLPNYPSRNVYTRVASADQPDQEVRLIFQGTIGKNLALESILPLLNERIAGRRLRLILKGGVRPDYKKELTSLAEKLGVTDALQWVGLGPYVELPSLTQSCHIGLAIYMGQDDVGLTIGTASNKIYEYAASGLPVLLYDNEQLRKYLKQYDWAYFTDGSTISIKEQLTRMLDQHPVLSAAARNDFESSLNFEQAFRTVRDRLIQLGS